MSRENLDLSISGENAAIDFLETNSYKIIERNYKTRLGEIDIIARDKDTVCFVEVKTRRSNRFGLPQESVNLNKQKQISKTALCYLKAKNLLDKKARFDVVSVIYTAGAPRLDLIKDAFALNGAFTY